MLIYLFNKVNDIENENRNKLLPILRISRICILLRKKDPDIKEGREKVWKFPNPRLGPLLLLFLKWIAYLRSTDFETHLIR